MKVTKEALEGIEKLAQEGRVEEHGKPLIETLKPRLFQPYYCPAHVGEKEFQKDVLELCDWFGWAAYHTYDSRKSNPGFPDLVLARERVLFVELKVSSNKMSDHQLRWMEYLLNAGAEWYEWRPKDQPDVLKTLEAKK